MSVSLDKAGAPKREIRLPEETADIAALAAMLETLKLIVTGLGLRETNSVTYKVTPIITVLLGVLQGAGFVRLEQGWEIIGLLLPKTFREEDFRRAWNVLDTLVGNTEALIEAQHAAEEPRRQALMLEAVKAAFQQH